MDNTKRQGANDTLYARFPGLPAFSFYAIRDTRLWHGRNPLTTEDIERLKAEGITHLLDLRQPFEWGVGSAMLGGDAVAALADAKTGITRKHIAIPDGGIPGDFEFSEGVAFLENTLRDPAARVYVHCRLGRERTGTILAAYYAKANGITAHEAIAALNALGAKIQPNHPQMAATREWVERRRNVYVCVSCSANFAA